MLQTIFIVQKQIFKIKSLFSKLRSRDFQNKSKTWFSNVKYEMFKSMIHALRFKEKKIHLVVFMVLFNSSSLISISGQPLHIHSSFSHCVLPPAGRNYSSYIFSGTFTRKVCAVHHDSGYFQVNRTSIYVDRYFENSSSPNSLNYELV